MARTVSQRYRFLASVVAGIALIVAQPHPARAQGFFDLLFGGGRSTSSAPSSYADPRYDPRGDSRTRVTVRPRDDGERSTSSGVFGSGTAYCVRTCDGRYFPIRTGGNAAELCRSLCPATPTQVFSGGSIEGAHSQQGKRYTDLPNALVYRSKLVPGCTCDGKSPTGLARLKLEADPTLRPGDIVATARGLMAYQGENRKTATFAPISQATGLSANLRWQLSRTRIQPERSAQEIAETTADASQPNRAGDPRHQAAR